MQLIGEISKISQFSYMLFFKFFCVFETWEKGLTLRQTLPILQKKMIPLITITTAYFVLIHCVFLISRKGPKILC